MRVFNCFSDWYVTLVNGITNRPFAAPGKTSYQVGFEMVKYHFLLLLVIPSFAERTVGRVRTYLRAEVTEAMGAIRSMRLI